MLELAWRLQALALLPAVVEPLTLLATGPKSGVQRRAPARAGCNRPLGGDLSLAKNVLAQDLAGEAATAMLSLAKTRSGPSNRGPSWVGGTSAAAMPPVG